MKISNEIEARPTVQKIQRAKKVTVFEENPFFQRFQQRFPLNFKGAFPESFKEISNICHVLAATPDMRINKVKRLRRAIGKGQYYVSSDSLAKKIIRDLILELGE